MGQAVFKEYSFHVILSGSQEPGGTISSPLLLLHLGTGNLTNTLGLVKSWILKGNPPTTATLLNHHIPNSILNIRLYIHK